MYICSSYYKALAFYLQEQSTLLTDLLTMLIPCINHMFAVHTFHHINHIPSHLIVVQQVRLLDFIS